MRRKIEIDVMSAEIKDLLSINPKINENAEKAAYYEGVLTALKWVQDKSGEETYIWHGEPPVWMK